jgi:hypothetical protein
MAEASGPKVDPARRQIIRWGGLYLAAAAALLIVFVAGVKLYRLGDGRA